MLSQFYEDEEKPSENFDIASMLGEVMLSYALLFRVDRRSRKVYQSCERARASLEKSTNQIQVDPCLDELCGNNISASFFTFGSSVRDSYDSGSDFPIFKNRLKKIQDYMEGIQPNRFKSLWRDRRDLRLWYTIWVVIILGVLGLVVSLVSMFLAAAQVNLARLAYESQLQQT
ncbi:MAG: hypothetical protein L6R38_004854 [Xanthoria sp. 2 TBL-2021]|nr:MAG: hypothetical protein L6R38_004854 [Xanthoria sp. 2 TBL-2021]